MAMVMFFKKGSMTEVILPAQETGNMESFLVDTRWDTVRIYSPEGYTAESDLQIVSNDKEELALATEAEKVIFKAPVEDTVKFWLPCKDNLLAPFIIHPNGTVKGNIAEVAAKVIKTKANGYAMYAIS